jgi:hypothetical protein
MQAEDCHSRRISCLDQITPGGGKKALNEPPRGKPRGIFKGKIHFIAAPLSGISASLQQAAVN